MVFITASPAPPKKNRNKLIYSYLILRLALVFSLDPISEHRVHIWYRRNGEGRGGAPNRSSVDSGSSLFHSLSVCCNTLQFGCHTHSTGKWLQRVWPNILRLKTIPITQAQMSKMKMAEPTLLQLPVRIFVMHISDKNNEMFMMSEKQSTDIQISNSCLLLCNRSPQNVVAWNYNKHLASHTVSVGQKPGCSFSGWFWLEVLPEVIVKVLARDTKRKALLGFGRSTS